MRRLFFFSLVFVVAVFCSGLFFVNNTLAGDCPGDAVCDKVGDCAQSEPITPITRCDTGLGFEGTCCVNKNGSGGSDNGGGGGGGNCPGGECAAGGNCSAGFPVVIGYCTLPKGGTGTCCMPQGGSDGPSGPGVPSGPEVGAPAGSSCPSGFVNKAGVCFPGGTGLSSAPVYEILYKLVWWLLAIVGFIGIIAFTISGMQYLLSAGNEEMAKTAKNSMKYSIIGMVVALSGLVIIFFIHDMLAGELVLFFNIGF